MAVRNSSAAAQLARIVVFAALIAALGMLAPIPIGPVPITAQTLGIILAGSILGWRSGALSVLLLLALVAAGLPLLSGGRGGIGVFFGPTGGYLVGWVAGVIVIGLLARKAHAKVQWWRVAIAGVVGGIVVIYLFGVPVQAMLTEVSVGEAAFLSLAFIPGDLAKVAIATLLTVAVAKAYPPAFADAPREKRVERTNV